MSRLLPGLGIVLPLLEGVVVRAIREESVLELGSVPVMSIHDPAVVVVVEVTGCEGRGWWTPGFWWPDEAEPRWAEVDRPLRRERVALPVHADEYGAEPQVRVMARLRPSGRALARFSAMARFPT